jgi:DNA gyrase subunit A
MYDIPEGKRATKGKSIMNFISLESEEKVTSILPIDKEVKSTVEHLVMVTKMGVVKKVSAESFKDVRRSGLIAIKLDKNDELQEVLAVVKGDDIMLATTKGQSIRFKESDVREMGRSAGGVRAIKLSKDDFVIGVDRVPKGENALAILTLSANGLGKKTKVKEYKTQKRGGSGIKTAKVTPKTGRLIVAKIVGEENEIIAVSQKGQVIRVELKSIPTSGRQTQGVTIMKLKGGDSIASITCL